VRPLVYILGGIIMDVGRRGISSFLESRLGPVAGLGAVSLVLFGCDLSVSNPGPVPDSQLNEPGSYASVVQGAVYELSRGLTRVAFLGSDPALEILKAGRNNPTKLPTVSGQLHADDLGAWSYEWPARARWVAEAAVARFRETMGTNFATSGYAAEALLYAGYANRILGENMCHAVIDGGPAEPPATHLTRAETYFSEAATVAGGANRSDLRLAALAGRASVRAGLGDWAGAVGDAGQVPDDFAFEAVYSGESINSYNFVFEINNIPWRTLSVYTTYYENYYQETGDARVAWGINPAFPVAEFTDFPWYRPLKYTSRGSPKNLSSGREMRLIEAEAALRGGQWQVAMTTLNSLRTGVTSDVTGEPLLPWVASNVSEAWTHLKRERGIELWLEGRRMGDLNRWIAEGAPGEMEDMRNRVRLCIPISLSERRSNPNIPLDLQDPVNPIYDPSVPKPTW